MGDKIRKIIQPVILIIQQNYLLLAWNFTGTKPMKHLHKQWILTCIISGLCLMVQGQTLNEAKELYAEGKYAEAKPAFEKFVKQAPSNSSYNLWYGVCCFETGDLQQAEKYLEVAVRRRVIDGFRYMGELYCKTFRFEKAAEMYEDYIKYQKQKKRDTEEAELRLDIIENAVRMLDKVEAVEVIDSIVVNKEDILSAYTLSEESGYLISPEEFSNDIQTDSTVIYKNQKGDKIYYARRTEEGPFRLFTQSWLLNIWGDEKQLAMNQDSGGDDNYPFVMPDGVTVYFASKGNGSIGGYDLFVTRYNTETNTYLSPEQLGMPFNSPYNDYMLVIDEAKGLGWFVSDRFQPSGMACVYLFIPNKNNARVESDDIELKRSWASLMPIRTTWKNGADYSRQISLAHEAIPYGKQEKDMDFEFAVSPTKIYHKWEEFRSSEAKALYQRVVSIKEQTAKLEEELESLRKEYTSSNASKKGQLSDNILQKEQRLNELLAQPAELEKQARNAEASHLRNR